MMKKAIFLLVLILGSSQAGLAQSPGFWRTQDLCECRPVTLEFDPTIGGYAIATRHSGPPWYDGVTNGRSHWRTYKGLVWKLLVDTSNQSYQYGIPQRFAARDEARLMFAEANAVYYSIDSGRFWQLASGGTGVMGVKMFTQDSGYKIMSNYNDSTVTAYLTYGETLGFFDRAIEHTIAPRAHMPKEVRIISRDTLLTLSSAGVFETTTDKGKSWKKTFLTEGLSSNNWSDFGNIVLSTDASRYYVTGGFNNESDYFETIDFGKTWIHHSGYFNSRLVRLAESSRELLFGVVMDTLDKRQGAGNLFEAFAAPAFGSWRPAYGDTLVYTTDRGLTWQVEQRFVGDTISHLIAGDSGRVYVMHYRNGHTFISTFTPGTSSVDVISSTHSTLKVYPNPSSTSIKFTLPVSERLHVRFVNLVGQPLYDGYVQHDASRESVIEYPENMRAFSGPFLMRVESPWYSIGQLVIKY